MGVPRGRSPSGKFRMCPDRVHPVQNGMPFCETCLSSPPRLQRFLRGVDVGKAASVRALLSPHPPPKKSSATPQGDDSGFVIFRRKWVNGKQSSVPEDCFLLVHCRRKITRLRSRRHARTSFSGNMNRNFYKNTVSVCLIRYCFVAQFVKHRTYFISDVLQTVQHCQTYCETKIKIFLQSSQISKSFFR